MPKELQTGGKKWSTKEIFKDVKAVCYQLQKGKDDVNGREGLY